MTAYTAREVRAWAAASNIDCPGTGRVPQRVVDAYLLDVHGVDASRGHRRARGRAGQRPRHRRRADVPRHHRDPRRPRRWRRDRPHILEAVYAAFESGRRVRAARMLEQLGGAA